MLAVGQVKVNTVLSRAFVDFLTHALADQAPVKDLAIVGGLAKVVQP